MTAAGLAYKCMPGDKAGTLQAGHADQNTATAAKAAKGKKVEALQREKAALRAALTKAEGEAAKAWELVCDKERQVLDQVCPGLACSCAYVGGWEGGKVRACSRPSLRRRARPGCKGLVLDQVGRPYVRHLHGCRALWQCE